MWGRLLVVALAAAGCERPAPAPLRVGTDVFPGYEPLYLARQRGLLDGAQVRLVEYGSGTHVLRAFRNGTVEAAALTLDEVFLLLDSGLDAEVVLVTDFSEGADVVLGRPDVATLAELKGKRVGVEDTALGAFVLARALESAGLSLADVQPVHTQASEHEAAFAAGKVDAVVTFEPVRTRLLEKGARPLFDSSRLPGEIVDVVVVRRDVARSQPERVRHLQRAWYGALALIAAAPDEALAQMAPRLGLSPDELRLARAGLRVPTEAEARQLLAARPPELLAPARRLSAFLASHALLRHEVDPAPCFEGSAPP